MRVLITAPSLDENRNVSGISTVVRQILEYGRFQYIHFQAGREDAERTGLRWMTRQLALPLSFARAIGRDVPDVVHINTALTERSIWRDAILAKTAAIRGCPIVLSLHGGRYLLEEIKKPFLARAANALLRAARSVIVLSENERQLVERRWQGLDIRVVPNAVPVRDVPIAKRDNVPPVIVFIGRLHASKGLFEMVGAISQLLADGVEFRVECYGDGPEREAFLGQMNAAVGDRFHYGGVVAGRSKYAVLDHSDIFILPSIYGEGLPMAILEAMSAGCIVIASEMASVADVIDDGRNGFLTEPGNTRQLVDKLRSVLNDRQSWTDVRASAVQTVRDKFNIDGYIKLLEATYSDAAAIDQ